MNVFTLNTVAIQVVSDYMPILLTYIYAAIVLNLNESLDFTLTVGLVKLIQKMAIVHCKAISVNRYLFGIQMSHGVKVRQCANFQL